MAQPAQRKSWVWSFVTLSDDKSHVICDLCRVQLSYGGSTSASARHLRSKHIEECPGASANEPALECVRGEGSNEDIVVSHCEPTPSKVFRKGPFSAKRQEEITQALAQMISTNMLPISFADSAGFAKFMEVVEPQYECPCPTTILKRLQLVYKEKREKIEKQIEDASSVSVTIDGWSSRKQDSYLSLTAHFITGDWEMKSYTLCTQDIEGRHTAENITAVAISMQEEWKIAEKLIGVVHDNASNMHASASLLENLKYSVSCAAHTLQLAIKDALDTVGKFTDMIKKSSKIVQHFHHSNLATFALLEAQKQYKLPELKLIQSCPTRWNSTFSMCDRLVRNREAIHAVLSNRKITKLNVALKLEMALSDWEVLGEIIEILEPFNLATEVLCSETKVTISLVLPIIHGLINNHLNDINMDTVEAKEFKNILRTSLARRFDIYSYSESAHQIACFLDPRSKDLTFENIEVKNIIINSIRNRIRNLSINENNTDNGKTIPSALDFIYKKKQNSNNSDSEMDMYLLEPQIDHNSDPLPWWKAHADKYKRLAELAKTYLSIPATSASSERTFSSAGNIITTKRTCLLPENVDLLVFLHQNRNV